MTLRSSFHARVLNTAMQEHLEAGTGAENLHMHRLMTAITQHVSRLGELVYKIILSTTTNERRR